MQHVKPGEAGGTHFYIGLAFDLKLNIYIFDSKPNIYFNVISVLIVSTSRWCHRRDHCRQCSWGHRIPGHYFVLFCAKEKGRNPERE